MKTFNFNTYEKMMINAMMQANITFNADGGFLYYETRALIRKSITIRLKEDTIMNPSKIAKTVNNAMAIVDKLVEIGLEIAY